MASVDTLIMYSATSSFWFNPFSPYYLISIAHPLFSDIWTFVTQEEGKEGRTLVGR